MTSRRSTKDVFAVCAALVVLVINIFITTRFIFVARSIIALQSSSAIRLPVAKSAQDSEPQPTTLALTMRADGTTFAGDIPVANDSLGALLRARSPTKVVIRAAPGVRYEQLKALLIELGNNGTYNVVIKANETN